MKTIWRKSNAAKGLEVSIKGGVRRTYDDVRTLTGKGLPQMMSRHVDANGNLYVEIKKPRPMDLRIDRLVANCYHHTVGKRLQGQVFIIHKDREKTHCWAENLKWATPYEHGEFYANEEWVNTPDGYRLVLDDIYVSKEGKVKMNGKELTIYDSFFDPDMDREAAVSPFVYVEEGNQRKRLFIEYLVAAAYIRKPEGLGYTALLHKDLDYKNCALDNLEWVRYDSNEFKQYLKKREADIEDRLKELNPYPVQHFKFG
jgi:hypothetical protein